MTLTMPTVTYEYAVKDCKIEVLTTDPIGGTAAYSGQLIDVPGIKTVNVTPNANIKELMGDNTLLDSRSKVNYAEVEITFAKFSYDLWPAFIGGVVTKGGTDPAQTTKWDWGFQNGSYFRLAAVADGVDIAGGDAHLDIWKMNILTPPKLGFVEEDYSEYTVTGRCYKRLADGKAMTKTLNQTATDIAIAS